MGQLLKKIRQELGEVEHHLWLTIDHDARQFRDLPRETELHLLCTNGKSRVSISWEMKTSLSLTSVDGL